MSPSSKNGRQEARPGANEDEKERQEEVYCEDRIASSNACRVVGIWLVIGIQKYSQLPHQAQKGPVRPATKLRLAHKKIFIVDEVSMVGLEALVQLDDRCNAIWDLNREGSTVFGGLPIVIFLGDFNQFTPVGGHAIWRQDMFYTQVLQAGKSIWN